MSQVELIEIQDKTISIKESESASDDYQIYKRAGGTSSLEEYEQDMSVLQKRQYQDKFSSWNLVLYSKEKYNTYNPTLEIYNEYIDLLNNGLEPLISQKIPTFAQEPETVIKVFTTPSGHVIHEI